MSLLRNYLVKKLGEALDALTEDTKDIKIASVEGNKIFLKMGQS